MTPFDQKCRKGSNRVEALSQKFPPRRIPSKGFAGDFYKNTSFMKFNSKMLQKYRIIDNNAPYNLFV